MTQYRDYKNYNMCIELSVAGEFIYNGIHDIYMLSEFKSGGPTFSALYNISVGIERLQKIVYVLWGMDKYNNPVEFEKSLITHSHTELLKKIIEVLTEKNESLQLSKAENELLLLLTQFYNSTRYIRFNVNGECNKEILLLNNFLKEQRLIDQENNDQIIRATHEVKEFIGRTVGKIAKKLYELVKKGSEINGTFTYENNYESKAYKIFVEEYRNNSLIEVQTNEVVSAIELLLFFRKYSEKHSFFRYIDQFEPLDFDPALVVEYIEDLCKGKISQDLIDDVDTLLHDKYDHPYDRVKEVSLVGTSNIDYEIFVVGDCWEAIKQLKENMLDNSNLEFLKDCKEYIEDKQTVDIITRIISTIESYSIKKDPDLHCILSKLSDDYNEIYRLEK